MLAMSPAFETPVALAASSEAGGLPIVTVTARFREENLQATPLAITAFTSANLEARTASSTLDLDAFVPNAVIAPLGAGWGSTAAMFIRGIGLGDNSLSFEPGVPIYIDDVYFGRPQGAILDLLDLERVEILRGPQGTLFGKNALGGAVRFISKKPQGDGTGYVEGTYGTRNRINVRGSLDVSIVPDRLFTRLSFSSKTQDGYFRILDYECVNGAGTLGSGGPGITSPKVVGGVALGSVLGPQDTRAKNCVVDHLGDENVQSGRAAFRLIGSEDLEFNFTGDVTKIHQKGPADKYTYMNATTFALWGIYNNNVAIPVFGQPWDDRFLTSDPYGGYHRYGPDPLTGRDVENVNNLLHWGISGTIDWDISDVVHAKSITAYRKFSNTFGRDSDGSPLPLDHTWDTSKHDQFSQEIQLTGDFAQRLEWTLGGFYYRANDSNQGWNLLAPFIVFQNHHDEQDIKNWALFGHLVFHVTDRLSVSGGLRYTSDKKQADIYRQNALTLAAVINHTIVNVDQNKWSPKVSIDYQATDNLMVYASYSTGFRGGGFGPRPSNSRQVASFLAEDLDNYEVGFKSDLFENRVRFNGTFFYSLNTNKQSPSQECAPCGTPGNPDPITGREDDFTPWFRTVNAGKSRTYGAEFEVQAEPIDGLQIDAALGYQNYFLKDPGISTIPQYGPDGKKMWSPRTPEWTWSFGAQYRAMLGNAGSITPRIDWTYQSRINFNTDPVNGFQDGYHIINTRITWASPENDWNVSFYVLNLTDKYYFLGKLSLVGNLGREQGNPAAPREWGVTVKRTF